MLCRWSRGPISAAMQFGPFAIHTARWELTREGVRVELSPRLVEILGHLATSGGSVVTKDALLDRFWPDVHVTENTVARAVADIRKAIDDDAGAPKYIQTVARRGYRFIAERTDTAGHPLLSPAWSASETETGTDPFLLWVRGKISLESLDQRRLPAAMAAFERAVEAMPRYALAHVGLANACFLRFECGRLSPHADRALLARAVQHAREATILDPTLGEGWATLGHVLAAAGETEEARAAARHAIVLEPASWRHYFRLANATWGDERLRAVDRTLVLLPDFVPAHFLAAMVFIARQAWEPAERVVRRGVQAQVRQPHHETMPFPALGLQWLLGLLHLAKGEATDALESFAAEVEGTSDALVYGREFAVNGWSGIGYAHLATGDTASAVEAFEKALARSPSHGRSLLGLMLADARNGDDSVVDGRATQVTSIASDLGGNGRVAESAMLTAGLHVAQGRMVDAAQVLDDLLAGGPPGEAVWLIPLDPMLAPLRQEMRFGRVLARLAALAA